jgi:DNA-binding transcriptional LysR family regulator
MELRQLRYFVAVAEELHFRRAAERLHVSQPPVSQQIRALEQEIGCRLLARTRRRVELTPAGAAFLRDARGVLAELDGAVATAQRIHSGQSGSLRVNFVGSALLSIVPRAVQRFRSAAPEVQIELRERATVDQLRAVLDGAVDVGLVRTPIEADERLRVTSVLREPTVAAVPGDHPLSRRRRVALREVAAHPLVLFPRSQAPGFHDLVFSSLAATGTAPRVVQYAPETQTIIGLVAAGLGLSLVPASVARLALDGVCYRPVTSPPAAELAAISRADRESSLVAAFIAQAREAGQSEGSAD